MQGEFQKSFHTVNLLDGVNWVNCFYYMADSASRQDDANPVFWLATQAGKMGPSCPLRIARFGPVNKRLLGAGLRSSLTLQNETVYKKLIITSAWQG